MTLYFQIERLINFAQQAQLIEVCDITYIRNQYFELFDLVPKLPDTIIDEALSYPDEILNALYLDLQNSALIKTAYLGKNKDIITNRIMNVLLPKPGEVLIKFNQLSLNQGVHAALDWLYNFSIASFYIKMQSIRLNKNWLVTTKYGNLEITVNLSKPEKDPREIARAKLQPLPNDVSYVRCLLCVENEGFRGTDNHPARHNLRLIPLVLAQKTWYFQFSPYVYYHQHAIVLNHDHVDMQINADTFRAFFDFVDYMPEYFIGSNADIPIVGGSILTHDHYQVGKHIFPIEVAEDKVKFNFKHYPGITASIINWPITTLRLFGGCEDLQSLAEEILNLWYNYSDLDAGIIAYTETDTRHNAITPILRKLGQGYYRLDLLLRNNRTSIEYPDGVFHPHQNLHHIKKENIGLIEAMGLAILPGRLDLELSEITAMLLKNDITLIQNIMPDNQLYKHQDWLFELFARYTAFTESTILQILRDEIGQKFTAVLTDCGVFNDSVTLNNFLNQLVIIHRL